jgi:hypothetical protein
MQTMSIKFCHQYLEHSHKIDIMWLIRNKHISPIYNLLYLYSRPPLPDFLATSCVHVILFSSPVVAHNFSASSIRTAHIFLYVYRILCCALGVPTMGCSRGPHLWAGVDCVGRARCSFVQQRKFQQPFVFPIGALRHHDLRVPCVNYSSYDLWPPPHQCSHA